MPAHLDILIPTFNRPAALAVTLTSLCAQDFRDFRVVISDQTEDFDAAETGEVKAVLRVLRAHGHVVDVHKHLPRCGIAEQRQHLLDQVTAPYALFMDDDVITEPDLIGRMVRAIQRAGCGFVGSALLGLGYTHIHRPHDEGIMFWDGPVTPEEIRPEMDEWHRVRLHSAANLIHVTERLGLTVETERLYKVSWVGGCAIYDTAKLRAVGGYTFWPQLPLDHSGEDVLVQIRLLRRFGGCGLIPSGAYHQELPTTLPVRGPDVDAPFILPLFPPDLFPTEA